MSKNKDLAEALTDRHGLSKQDAEKFVNAMFGLINDALSSDKIVKVKGLGTFKVISVAPRKSVDVNTGEPIVIEGRDKISFIPDSSMRDEVNKPFAQFDTVIVNDGVDFSEIDKKYSTDENVEVSEHQVKQPEAKEEHQEENPEQLETKAEEQPEMTEALPEQPEQTGVLAEQTKVQPEQTVVQTKQSEVRTEQIEKQPKITEDYQKQIDTDVERPEHQTASEEQQTEESPEEVAIPSSIKVEKNSYFKIITATSVAIVAICLAGVVYLFTQLQKRDNRIANLEAQVTAVMNETRKKPNLKSQSSAKQKENVLTKEILTASADNKSSNNTDETIVQSAHKATDEPKSKTKTVEKVEVENSSNVSSSNYDSDPRIRTGAYNIVGIDQIITVKSGQTLSSISKFYFGSGMECYLEAVNGGKTNFKAGDKIKIPKLKHKRKK